MSASRELTEIASKLQSVIDTLTSLDTAFTTTTTAAAIPSLIDRDRDAMSVMPEALKRFMDIVCKLERDFKRVIKEDIDLGAITTYAGSVFNPQKIPVVQVLHCIISDMDMLLTDTKTILCSSSNSIDYTQAINNIYAVIASSRFIYRTQEANEDIPKDKFPFSSTESNIDDITSLFSDFDDRVQTIGVE